MGDKNSFCIEFAGLRVKFSFPDDVMVPDELVRFLIDDIGTVDAEYSVCMLEEPLQMMGKPITCYRGMEIYSYKKGWLRVFTSLTAQDGCQVACYTNKNQRNILYYPASKWDFYSSELHFLHLLGIEELLLQNKAFLLHSAIVRLQNQMILFSGPSGAGKSTQASLWETYLGADIINGDRCIIRKLENDFWGCGSPWAGTSGIYKNEQAPIKGIFILQQAKENTVTRIRKEAFIKIYQQSIINTWNKDFVSDFVSLIEEVVKNVPIFQLSCRADEEAVRLAYQTIFEGDV